MSHSTTTTTLWQCTHGWIADLSSAAFSHSKFFHFHRMLLNYYFVVNPSSFFVLFYSLISHCCEAAMKFRARRHMVNGCKNCTAGKVTIQCETHQITTSKNRRTWTTSMSELCTFSMRGSKAQPAFMWIKLNYGNIYTKFWYNITRKNYQFTQTSRNILVITTKKLPLVHNTSPLDLLKKLPIVHLG